jgi:hypothetical protein
MPLTKKNFLWWLIAIEIWRPGRENYRGDGSVGKEPFKTFLTDTSVTGTPIALLTLQF